MGKKRNFREPAHHFEAAEGVWVVREGLSKVLHAISGRLPKKSPAMNQWGIMSDCVI